MSQQPVTTLDDSIDLIDLSGVQFHEVEKLDSLIGGGVLLEVLAPDMSTEEEFARFDSR
ncbi:hypothetical protein [Actinomadura craniellae]|nr:hypothetical protein [Actinomadura craniellae]